MTKDLYTINTLSKLKEIQHSVYPILPLKIYYFKFFIASMALGRYTGHHQIIWKFSRCFKN